MHTARHPKGKLTHSALAIAANDLPAARQLNQCAAITSHHYCSRCRCFHKDTHFRTDIDSPDWEPKDVSVLQKAAEAWQMAATVDEQTKLFQANGIHWTELWHFPYWDPTQMLVVNSMHCLLEGLAQYQFKEVLGLTDIATKVPLEPVASFQFKFAKPDD